MNLTHHKNSKISVIVTIYNYEIFLEETINSLKSQQLSLHEIIIVDDASSDNSREVIQRLAADSSNVIPVLLEKNVGQLGAFNAGVARATGDIISFIDADDTWQPNYTAEVAQVFLKEPKCDYLFTGYRQFGDATGEFLTKPLFPALRSGPTAVTRPSRQKQIPSSSANSNSAPLRKCVSPSIVKTTPYPFARLNSTAQRLSSLLTNFSCRIAMFAAGQPSSMNLRKQVV